MFRVIVCCAAIGSLAAADDLEDALKRLRSSDPAVREEAIEELGANVRSLEPLSRLLGEPDEHLARAAHDALVRYHQQPGRVRGVDAVVGFGLTSTNRVRRRRCARLAWAIGRSLAMDRVLWAQLDDEDPLAKLEAAATLASYERGGIRTARILAAALSDPNGPGFEIALRGLRDAGSTATVARVALRKMLKSTPRVAIARAYVGVGGDPHVAADIYAGAITSGSEDVAGAVAGVHEAGIANLDRLLVASRDADARVRRNAAWGLVSLGWNCATAMARLKELREDPESTVADAAARKTTTVEWPRKRYETAFGFGGGPGRPDDVNPAIEAGLAWLAKHQEKDGRWDVDGFMRHDPADDPCFGPGSSLSDVRATALVLLAFLGGGYTDEPGSLYVKHVGKAIRFLMAQQDGSGRIAADGTDHAVATYALTESYWMTRDKDYRAPATRAFRAVTAALREGKSDALGRWYGLIAVKSARFGGLGTADAAVLKPHLDWLADPAHAKVPRAATATLFCRVLWGHDPATADMQRLAAACGKGMFWSPRSDTVDLERIQFASLGFYQCQGELWNGWTTQLHSIALEQHNKDAGPLAGSWDPVGRVGWEGGRVYTTAMAILSLESWFRYALVYAPKKK